MSKRFFKDIRDKLGWSIDVALDVGANVGQTALRFRDEFPEAEVHSFEPITSTYRQLAEAVAGHSIECHNVALGRAPGSLRMAAVPGSVNNGTAKTGQPSQDVEVTTGDHWCRENDIVEVSLLKIDTEGFDLDVLVGFSGLLQANAVKIVQVEAGINRANTKHVPLEAFRGFLEPMGYGLFGLYDQVSEFRGVPLLRRCNPVFIATG